MKKHPAIPDEIITQKIFLVKNQKVMRDADLAVLYGVETKQLKRQVKRNIARFPKDFMFQLTRKEYNSLRSQFGTLKRGEHTKYLPYVFTEQGVAMLSSVLNSERAIKVNIQIMRIFTKIREIAMTHKDVLLKLEQLERKFEKHDEDILAIFDTIKAILSPAKEPRRLIGFKRDDEK